MARQERDTRPMQQRDDLLVFDRRQASIVVATLILIAFFIFISGYFWGKKRAMEQFVDQVSQGSFADQVYYASLYSTYDGSSEAENNDNEPELVNETEEPAPVQVPTAPTRAYY